MSFSLLPPLIIHTIFSSTDVSVPKMVINNAKFPLPFFLNCIFCLWAVLSVAAAQEDPELQQCKHQCRVQPEASERQLRECEQQCEDYYGEHREPVVDPAKQLQQCLRQCELPQPGRERERCRRECRQRYDQQNPDEGGRGGEEEREKDSPFVFRDQNFASFRTDRGEVKILEKFDQRSRLLRGLKNYRFIFLEANPQTFVVPTHYDADIVGFVARGQGTITMVCQGKRRGFRIKTGDIVRIPAGITFQLINSHKDQKLRIAYFLLGIGIPGRFEPFHGAAGENPQSFYRAFSPKLLSSAFRVKVEEETLEKVFQQQTKGNFIKATEEQIQTLSRQNGDSAPVGSFTSGESKRPVFNLLNKVPSACNNYGRLHEADGDDFRPLKDMDVGISYANITQGGMMGPFYNSRSTMVAAVVEGEGYFEMACPHLSKDQQQQEANPIYQKVTSSLRPGTLVVVPTGHPIAIVAGINRTLEIVRFGINAQNNRIEALAGKGNVVNELEKEAKELAFALPARAVDRVFRSQKQELFFPGPELQEQQHHHHHHHHHHHKEGRDYA